MNSDINTRFITLIGTPLDQSFAARMQNAGYEAGGIDMCYFYTETGNEHLEQIINGIRFMPSFIGAAITKPNKVEVIKYLDELDPLCEKMGACNTVVKQGDKLIGYNTDGVGFLRSLEIEADIIPSEHTFFCFGAGGAGRAMCSILAYNGARRIYITDINRASAEQLAADINTKFADIAVAVPHGDYSHIADSTAVLNASGIGMGSTIGQTPLPKEYIIPTQFYFDACYNPDKTQFLINAAERGCKVLNGLGMSLYQGVVQIELWAGVTPPEDAMRKELIKILKERAWTENHKESTVFGNKS